jgi:hypothetical protein
LRYVVKIIEHFFGAAPIQKIHQGVARRGMCPLQLGVFEGAGVLLIAKKILDL